MVPPVPGLLLSSSAATELASATEPDEEQPKAKDFPRRRSYLRAGEGEAR